MGGPPPGFPPMAHPGLQNLQPGGPLGGGMVPPPGFPPMAQHPGMMDYAQRLPPDFGRPPRQSPLEEGESATGGQFRMVSSLSFTLSHEDFVSFLGEHAAEDSDDDVIMMDDDRSASRRHKKDRRRSRSTSDRHRGSRSRSRSPSKKSKRRREKSPRSRSRSRERRRKRSKSKEREREKEEKKRIKEADEKQKEREEERKKKGLPPIMPGIFWIIFNNNSRQLTGSLCDALDSTGGLEKDKYLNKRMCVCVAMPNIFCSVLVANQKDRVTVCNLVPMFSKEKCVFLGPKKRKHPGAVL